MTVIPNFILKRMYRSGSLRKIPEGVAFDIVNNLGPGQISQVNGIMLNDQSYSSAEIILVINDEQVCAESIREDNPASFFLNQVISCIVRNADIEPGPCKIVLDLVSKEAGKVTLSVEDQLVA